MNTTRRLFLIVSLTLTALLGISYAFAPYFKTTKHGPRLSTFNLQATNGEYFNEKSLRGHWTLLFFGYPKCPDICPKTLGIVRDTWGLLGSNNSKALRFVFADISSNTDKITLQTFVTNYNPDFIGISGSTDAMTQLSSQLGVFQTTQNGRIDHTNALILIDPQARVRTVFTPPFDPTQLAADLQGLAII